MFMIALSLLGILLLALILILVTKILLAYVRVYKLFPEMRAFPEPPCSFWQRFTVGHNLVNLILYRTREECAEQIQQWRRRYGSIFQVRSLFGEPSLMITSLEAIQHITSVRNSSKYRKGPLVYNDLVALLGEKSMLLAEDSTHFRLRRVIAPALRHSSLISLHRVFVNHAQALTDTLLNDVVNPDDILQAIQHRSFGVIVDACFGNKTVPPEIFDKLKAEYFMAVREPADHMVRRAILQNIFNFLPPAWFGYQERVKKTIWETITNLIRMFDALSEDAQKTGKTSNSAMKVSPNLLTLVGDAERQQVLEEQEVVSLVTTFLVGGQVTTSFGISWLLYSLATHPEWQERVREEVSSWNSDAEDALTVIDEFPVLDRVVKESLRYDPPILFLARETIEPDVIDDFHIPKGVTIRIPAFAIQRDPTIWGPDANTFNPDRWLREDIQKLTPFFLVFWHGVRSCIGQRFAMLEMKTFTAAILKRASVFTRKEDPKPTAIGPFGSPLNMNIYVEPLTGRS